MTGNLKRFGVAVAMVLATSGMMATAASANAPRFTADSYPAHLDGKNIGTFGVDNAITVFGGAASISCADSTYTGTLESASSTLKVVPTFHKCGNNRTFRANSCYFVFHLGEFNGEHHGSGTVDIECEKDGDAIEVLAYTDTAHLTHVCTLKFPPQTGLTAPTYTVETGHHFDPETEETVATPSTDALIIEGTVHSIKYTSAPTFPVCPNATLEDGLLHMKVTVAGTTDDKPPAHNGLRMFTDDV